MRKILLIFAILSFFFEPVKSFATQKSQRENFQSIPQIQKNEDEQEEFDSSEELEIPDSSKKNIFSACFDNQACFTAVSFIVVTSLVSFLLRSSGAEHNPEEPHIYCQPIGEIPKQPCRCCHKKIVLENASPLKS